MKEFDYVIIGGGCAGLSLAYELEINDYILKQKNLENYNNAGKIYIPVYEKIIQTFLSFFDFIKLLFVKELSYENHTNHTILEKEVNLNERI